jgi:hypothetical protein
MNIPTRYEDLTVEQFQQLELLKSDTTLDKLDRDIKRLSILSGKSIDDIEALSGTVVYNHLLSAIFLTVPLTEMSSPNEFKLGNKQFRYIKHIYEYNIAQEKDWKEILLAHGNDYYKCLPELMAICHQEYENGKWVYNSDNHFENVELFKKSKLSESLGAVFFYSKFFKTYTKITADCLAQSIKVMTESKEMMMADQEFQTFLKDGGGSTLLV